MFELKESPIHGNGLFATQNIKKGQKLFRYVGDEMSLDEFKRRYGEYKSNSLNTYRMKRIHRIIVAKEEPFKSENVVNYVNESEQPNCVLKNRFLTAQRDVCVGEELTLRYPSDYYRNYELK